MAKETQIGQLVIDLKIKTEALEKGLETAKKKLQEIEQQNDKMKQSNNGLEGSYLALSAVAVASLMKIGSAIKDCVDEYKEYTQAMSSLQNVSEYTGQSMTEFSNIMDRFSTYMTKSDLATTIKNFSLMGMTAKQTEQMVEALTNSAIRNRNANYTVSEAVRVASEGYRQGLSTLSDSAGVTENLSVMLDNYAKSIGKTASQLTEAEKNQAYLNRTMYAAEPFASAMSDYMDTLAGKQGQYSQAMRETQVAYAEALEPTLKSLTTLGTEVLNITGQFIKDHPILTSGATSFATTLAGVTVALVALATAKTAYAKATGVATMSTKAFTTALLANPLTWIAIGIAGAIAGLNMLCTAINENEEATARLEATTKRYNEIKNGTFAYTDTNIAQLEEDKTKIEEQIRLLEQQIDLEQKINDLKNKKVSGSEQTTKNLQLTAYERQLTDVKKKLEEARDADNSFGNSLEQLKRSLDTTNKGLEKGNAIKNIAKALDTESIKNQQENAAQLKINAQNMQEYLAILKQGKTNTTEYQEAIKVLADKYPEAATSGGMLINVLEGLISAEQLQADEAWNASQTAIQGHIAVIEQALNDENVQKQVAENMGIAYDENFKPKLEAILSLLQMIGGYTPENVPNITPKTVSRKSYSGSSTYKNTRLDNYKKEIEYKKSLDKLSLQQEISMYQTALNKYAKTTDEKRELTTKIYELQKELQENELNEYMSNIEYKKSLDKLSAQEEISMYEYAYKNLAKTTEQKRDLEVKLYELRKELSEANTEKLKEEANKEKEMLAQKTKDYERYIQEQKNLRGAEYDVKDRKADLDKIIKLHQDYLSKILKDERYSLEERKEIYQEELDTIRDYEQQKRDLRVESIDNTVSQLTNAIKKQIQEMQDADKEAINKNIELVEKWKDARISAINEEYNARIKAIQDELDALDAAEEQKSRDEEDAEYERKKTRLQDLIAFEHDAVTKANYQKELDKLISEYQKTLDKRALQDKKDALNAQKDLLEEEQENKVQVIEEEAEKQKEVYNKQLEELDEYYNKQIDLAQETAEKMLLNVQKNQEQILGLLNKYGDKYEITGQSLGEKLAQGINNGIAGSIESVIQKIQDKLDTAIENQIAKFANASYQYTAGANKPQTSSKTVNVTQNNYIEQNPEMPSETYRKLNNTSQKLAQELAGI